MLMWQDIYEIYTRIALEAQANAPPRDPIKQLIKLTFGQLPKLLQKPAAAAAAAPPDATLSAAKGAVAKATGTATGKATGTATGKATGTATGKATGTVTGKAAVPLKPPAGFAWSEGPTSPSSAASASASAAAVGVNGAGVNAAATAAARPGAPPQTSVLATAPVSRVTAAGTAVPATARGLDRAKPPLGSALGKVRSWVRQRVGASGGAPGTTTD